MARKERQLVKRRNGRAIETHEDGMEPSQRGRVMKSRGRRSRGRELGEEEGGFRARD